MKTNDVCKWKAGQWWDNVKGLVPSSGGAVGVLFAYMQMDRGMGKKSLYEMPGEADFVIKPTSDTAATTKFAESMLKKIGGFLGTHTRPIERTSEVGCAIMNIIREKMNKGDQERQDRWKEVFPHYNTAKYFLIQETQTGFTEFGNKEREEGGMADMLVDRELMFNLGKLFVADAMIGNGDRLAKLNSGNIAFKKDSKNIVLIDSEAILQDYRAACQGGNAGLGVYFDEAEVNYKTAKIYSPENFAKCAVIGKANGYKAPTGAQVQTYVKNGKKPLEAPVLPASFGMEYLFCPKAWWKTNFRGQIEMRLQQHKLSTPADHIWKLGLNRFLEGVEKGMEEVDTVLLGRFRINWFLTKLKYRSLLGKYGWGANYDWTTFKIRRLYYKLRRANVDEAEAVTAAVNYADRKLAHLSA